MIELSADYIDNSTDYEGVSELSEASTLIIRNIKKLTELQCKINNGKNC